MTPPLPPLHFRWVRRAAEIETAWRRCFPADDVMRSFELQSAAEEAQLPEVEPYHLVGEDADGAVCVLPGFAFRIGLDSVGAPWLQRLVLGLRRVWRGLLRARVFVAGSPLSTSGDLLGLRTDGAGGWDRAAVLAAAVTEVRRFARRELGIRFVLFKELDEAESAWQQPALGAQGVFAPSPPTTYLDLPDSPGGYFRAIRSKYRNKAKSRRADGAEAGLEWERAPRAGEWHEEVYRLYCQTLARSDLVFERANRELFRTVERRLGDRCFYLLGFRRLPEGRRLVACELVLLDGQAMHPFYSGVDYALKGQSDLYFNVFYELIDEAERRGLPRLHLAQTAYEVKAELGAVPHRRFIALFHPNPLVRAVLRGTRRWLMPPVAFPRREVFGTPPAPRKSSRPAPSGPGAAPAR